MKNRNIASLLFAMGTAAFIVPSFVRADEPEAKRHIAAAKKLLESNDYKEAKTELDLAAAELDDDVAKDVKAALTKEIDAMKKVMGAANVAAKKEDLEKAIKYNLKLMQDDLGNDGFAQTYREFMELLNADGAKEAVGADVIAKTIKQANTLKKVSDQKYAERMLASFAREIDSLEKSLPEILTGLANEDSGNRDRAATDWEHGSDRVVKFIKNMPADNVDVKK